MPNLNFKYYRDSINEATHERFASRVVILTNESGESYTVPDIEKALGKRGIKYATIDVGKFEIVESENGESFIISDDKAKMKISPENTVILCRRGVLRNTRTQSLVQLLEDNQFFVVNSLNSMIVCENKYITSKILEDAGIPIPRMALLDNEDQIESAVEKIGGKYPIIAKLLSGSQGIGVSIVDSEASLKSVLQTLWKLEENSEILLQEKIDTDFDLRAHVLTRKFNAPVPSDTDSVLLGYMRRNKIEKDFRTNHSLGGSVEKTKLTEEQKDMAIAAAKAIGCNWCGVDMIVDKKSGKTYVLEVNSSPGTHGLKKATGIDVIKDVLDFVLDKKNWIRSRKTAGFREAIDIAGLGHLVAKFDTGNGAKSCSLSCDTIEEAGKYVTWTIGKKKFKSKIVGRSNAEVGDEKHDRPIIELDIQFAGKTYKKIHVSLTDRSDKSTKFLANRRFLSQIGCSVNPMKTFVLTSFDGDYSAKLAKKDPHAGIIFE